MSKLQHCSWCPFCPDIMLELFWKIAIHHLGRPRVEKTVINALKKELLEEFANEDIKNI